MSPEMKCVVFMGIPALILVSIMAWVVCDCMRLQDEIAKLRRQRWEKRDD